MPFAPFTIKHHVNLGAVATRIGARKTLPGVPTGRVRRLVVNSRRKGAYAKSVSYSPQEKNVARMFIMLAEKAQENKVKFQRDEACAVVAERYKMLYVRRVTVDEVRAVFKKLISDKILVVAKKKS